MNIKALLKSYWDRWGELVEGVPASTPEDCDCSRNYSWDLGGHGNWEEWSGYW